MPAGGPKGGKARRDERRQADAQHPHGGWRHIWAISWPVIIANITFPLVGAADAAMMGRLDDVSFVGGVALGTLVFNFIYFGLGFVRMATTGFVAQAHGRGDARAIEQQLVRGIAVALGLGFLFVAATPLVSQATVAALSASPAVEAHTQSYVAIRLLAVPAALSNMVLIGCMFGRQRMRLVMFHIVLVNMVNLALNFYFVLGLGMTVAGVAWASVVAQWFGLAVMLGALRWLWRDILAGVMSRTFRRGAAWLEGPAFARFFSIGGDITIRTLLIVLAEAVLLNRVATIGDVDLAVAQFILVIFGFIAFGLDGFAHAAEALVGEAVGKRSPGLLGQAIRRSNILSGATSVAMGLVIWFAGPLIVQILTTQPELARRTLEHWHWAALLPPVSFLAFQMDGVFVGAMRSRDMRNAMIVSAACYLALVFALEWLGLGGLDGLLLAFLLYLGLRGVTLGARMKHVRGLAEPAGPGQAG